MNEISEISKLHPMAQVALIVCVAWVLATLIKAFFSIFK